MNDDDDVDGMYYAQQYQLLAGIRESTWIPKLLILKRMMAIFFSFSMRPCGHVVEQVERLDCLLYTSSDVLLFSIWDNNQHCGAYD